MPKRSTEFDMPKAKSVVEEVLSKPEPIYLTGPQATLAVSHLLECARVNGVAGRTMIVTPDGRVEVK